MKRILISLVVLIILVAGGIYFWLKSSAPEYSGELKLQGLTAAVQVYYDDYGVPHIYAQNKHDLYLAFGYVHAQDRLFQMEMLRRAGSGRLAEIIGQPLIKVDRMFRTLGMVEYAKESAGYFETQKGTPMYDDVMAYLDGINQFMKDGDTPPEFSIIGIEKKPFTVEDLYCITGAMSFSFSQAQKTEPVVDFISQKYGKVYLQDLGLWHDPGETFIRNTNDQYKLMESTDTLSAPDTLISFQQHQVQPELSLDMALMMEEIEKLLPVTPLEGSNSWVVSGKKTKSGEVIFCNDTHIGYLLPQTWYEAHLNAPEFEMYGHFLSGVPFALVGRNRNLSWGLTMLLNDDMDFYYEKQNPENPEEYFHKGEKKKYTTIQHTIRVKGQEDTIIQVRSTVHGPVINDAFEGISIEQPISMFWTYTKIDNRTVDAFYGMNNSNSMSEFSSNLPKIHAPGLNMNYGDKRGNVAWWACAKLIKRPYGVNSWTILDGSTGDQDPLGYYPFRLNPNCINPSWGYIYSANDWPEQMRVSDEPVVEYDSSNFKEEQIRITDSSVLKYDRWNMKIDVRYPKLWYPGYYKPQYRADRIRKLLEAKDDWTLESMKEVMTDRVNESDATLLASWYETLTENPQFTSNDDYRQYDELFNWNGSYAPVESSPTFFNKMLYHYLHETLADEMGEDRFKLFLQTHQLQRTQAYLSAQADSPWWDNVSTEQKETKSEILFLVYSKSIAELREQFGNNPKVWNWRKAATLEFKHPLGEVAIFRPFFNVGPEPVYGGNETILQSGFKLDPSGEYKVFFGSQMRIMVDFADVDSSLNITPCGQSGHLMSKHYHDQAEMYREMKFRTQWMNRKDIEKFELLTFQPK